MTELIVVRHGETDFNRELRFQGQVDVPLNARGLAQAQCLAQRLARTGVQVDHMVCSDLQRARQTGDVLWNALGQGRPGDAIDAGWREQSFGLGDGLTVDDIQVRHRSAWEHWLRFEADGAMPQGESPRQLHARVMQALARTTAAYAGRTVLVVTHGGVLDVLWRHAHGQSLAGPRRCEIPNAALNRLRAVQVPGLLRGPVLHDVGVGAASAVSSGAPGAEMHLQILQWADAEHLAHLPPQPRYDQRRATDRQARPFAASQRAGLLPCTQR